MEEFEIIHMKNSSASTTIIEAESGVEAKKKFEASDEGLNQIIAVLPVNNNE